MSKVKTILEIWLMGGPSQLELFDPKPNASEDYNNGLKTISTNVSGLEMHEWFPHLAGCRDLFSTVRSLTHKQFGHESAVYLMQTGRLPGGGITYPAIGCVASSMMRTGYSGDLPPFVILTQSKGRFSEVGFLGEKYAPLVTGGNPNSNDFSVDGFTAPQGITKKDVQDRFALLEKLDTFGRGFNIPSLASFDTAGKEARRILSGSAAGTFRINEESNTVREAYGRTQYGQTLLAARRLIEYGIPYITVNLMGWDSHKRHFETRKRPTAEFDQALAALLRDLKEKHLLESTLVWVTGEFGRKPKIDRETPWNGGRNHWASCFSALVAGGGFRGGLELGRSDDVAGQPVERPVAPQDFLGSIYELAGIDPDGKMPNPINLDTTVLPPQSSEGRMKELYT